MTLCKTITKPVSVGSCRCSVARGHGSPTIYRPATQNTNQLKPYGPLVRITDSIHLPYIPARGVLLKASAGLLPSTTKCFTRSRFLDQNLRLIQHPVVAKKWYALRYVKVKLNSADINTYCVREKAPGCCPCDLGK